MEIICFYAWGFTSGLTLIYMSLGVWRIICLVCLCVELHKKKLWIKDKRKQIYIEKNQVGIKEKGVQHKFLLQFYLWFIDILVATNLSLRVSVLSPLTFFGNLIIFLISYFFFFKFLEVLFIVLYFLWPLESRFRSCNVLLLPLPLSFFFRLLLLHRCYRRRCYHRHRHRRRLRRCRYHRHRRCLLLLIHRFIRR